MTKLSDSKKSPHSPRRRSVLAVAAGLVASTALCMLPAASHASDAWPSHPLTIIVPFTPGTGIDVLARTIGQKLGPRLGQSIVVENRPGASGNIGTADVANAKPDGYTLLMTVNTLVMNASLYKHLPFDPVKSFVAVAPAARGALTLAVNPAFPAKTLSEAIDQFKAHPGKFTYASPGKGTPQHMAMELFKLHTGTDVLHVPYKGSAGAITDLIGGQVQAMILPVHSALNLAKGGKLRMLAVAQPQRASVAPEVPTFDEQGVHGADVDLWYGLMAPAGTPPDVVARLNKEVNAILTMPDVQATLEKQGLNPMTGSADILANLVKTDLVRWADVVKRAKISAD